MTSRIGWIIAGAVLVVVLVAGGVTAALVAGGDPHSVQEVADAAVDAAEDLDVDAGADLLCDAPSAAERRDLEDLIDQARDEADTEDPDADYEISDLEGDTEGSFTVRITSDDPAFDGNELAARVIVATHDGRSCIDGFEELD